MTVDATFIRTVETIAADLAALLVAKQHDYGPGNINNAHLSPMNGLLVRMGDKYERIKHLTASNATAKNEPLRDSFIDLANYCIIALMVIDNTWPPNERHQPCPNCNATSTATPTNAAASTPSSSIV